MAERVKMEETKLERKLKNLEDLSDLGVTVWVNAQLVKKLVRGIRALRAMEAHRCHACGCPDDICRDDTTNAPILEEATGALRAFEEGV